MLPEPLTQSFSSKGLSISIKDVLSCQAIALLGHNHVCNLGITDSIIIALVDTFAKIRAHIIFAIY